MTRSSHQVEVLVVGAGPVGLSAAVALAHAGVDVAVVDRDAGPIEQSRAVWVHPRTIELWDGIGIADAALARGRQLERIDIHTYRTRRGTIWYDGDDRTPHPRGLILEQSVTQRLLVARLAELGVTPWWRRAAQRVEQVDGGVQVEVARVDGDGAGFDGAGAGATPDVDDGVAPRPGADDAAGSTMLVRARYVLGADGASRTVRDQIGLTLKGGTYASSFFSADVVMDVPYERSRAHMSLTLDQTHAFLPLPGERRWRVVGNFTPDQEARYGQGAGPQGGQDLTRDDVADLVANVRVEHDVERVEWATVYRSHHRLVQHYRVGDVFLAGDAAHIHSPAGGLGMNTGIGDALNLAWKLAAVVRSEARDDLLDTYEAERRPVAQSVLDVSDRVFRLQASTGRVASALRVLTLPLAPAVLGLTARGRRLAFTVLSQIGISYRDAETTPPTRIGRVAAGDRLPYAQLGDGRTTHDLVDGRTHTALVVDGGPSLLAATRAAVATTRLPVTVFALPGSQALRDALDSDGPAVLLVRPDGHVGAVAGSDLSPLRAHLARWYAGGAPGPAPAGGSAPVLAVAADAGA